MLLGGCSVLDQLCTAPAIVCNEMTYALFAVLICSLPICTDQKPQHAVLKTTLNDYIALYQLSWCHTFLRGCSPTAQAALLLADPQSRSSLSGSCTKVRGELQCHNQPGHSRRPLSLHEILAHLN